ncbi:MAG TPA: hypothetical protein VD968_16355, partial [Pyrinomonadaceae bacterium]|nr:hypothetical protein [Pyrinomonadaceae bacterium]
MSLRETTRLSLVIVFILSLGFSSPAHAVQKGKGKKKGPPPGTPVLWRDHGDVSTLDLFNGPGGEEMKPELSSLTFIKEETGGYSKKYRVRDGKGRVWVAKIGKEAQPETAATRLLWAAGYLPEITYLAPRVTIPGKGTFENVRFEARPA